MNRKEIKDFLETLHFHGYIDHDITKLDNLIDEYFPKQLQQVDVMESDCDHEWLNHSFDQLGFLQEQICDKCGAKQSVP